MTPFLFVVGSARSGTTMLRLMLDAHPQQCVVKESHFIPELARSLADDFTVERFCDEVLTNRWYRRWGLDDDVVRLRLHTDPPVTFTDAVRRLYAVYAERRGKPRYGDKTPQYVRSIPLLSGLFAEARFIHIIRDGRDVVQSFLSTDIGPDRLDPGVRLWRDAVRDGREAGRSLGEQRYTEVRYEDLVADPEHQLRRLCDFADLDYEPAMLRYHETVSGVGRNHQALRRPPMSNLRDWRTEMPSEHVARFEAIAGDLLAELGYPPGAPAGPGTQPGAARGRVARGLEVIRRGSRGC